MFKYVAVFVAILSALSLAQNYIPGQQYFGTNEFVEYYAGNLPIVISIPHDGYKKPEYIPKRKHENAKVNEDTHTQEMGLCIRQEFFKIFNGYPHVIINQLHRSKLDANREIEEAACGNPAAMRAWEEYHHYIAAAESIVTRDYGKGLFVDLHAHGHKCQRLELGYLLDAAELQLSDTMLNDPYFVNKFSMRNLCYTKGGAGSITDIIRGKSSLGAKFVSRGYDAVPSLSSPYPENLKSYFRGGYNTNFYSSAQGGQIDGFQLECNYLSVRDSGENIKKFSKVFVEVIKEFLLENYFNMDELKKITVVEKAN